jgi:beta-lactam-binding protein with PASTA domain
LDGEDDGDVEDLSKLSVSDLKERLKAKGLPVGGKKADLIARLQDGEEE